MYKTSNMALAAALLVENHKLLDTEREKVDGKDIVYFLIETDHKTREIIEDYKNGNLRVDAQTFAAKLRYAKKLVYEKNNSYRQD